MLVNDLYFCAVNGRECIAGRMAEKSLAQTFDSVEIGIPGERLSEQLL